MHIFFIRHAQSVNNAIWAQTGNSAGRSEDPELTGLGKMQAQAVARHLREGDPGIYLPPGEPRPEGFGLTHLYVSLMLRSVQTGIAIAENLGLRPMAWEDLHECGGIYLEDEETGIKRCLPGKNRTYFEAQFPRLLLPEVFPEAGWWNSRPIEEPEDSRQ
ncbi:MAG: hypothetical protein EHM70_20100, partial [Chloroflexota bacterium]